jgi:uncharacterized membrane protein YgcG
MTARLGRIAPIALARAWCCRKALTFQPFADSIRSIGSRRFSPSGAFMAQKVQVILVDDVDGGEAAETVSFALDGVSYEIDVSGKNANALRDALAPWVGHARRVGGRSGGSGRSRGSSGGGGGGGRSRGSSGSGGGGGGKHDLSDVRSWARENGYQVSDRGRVSSEVIAAYEKAH